MQAYLGDIVGSAPGHHNKVSITTKQVMWIFGFPVHIKVVMLYCSILSMQQHV